MPQGSILGPLMFIININDLGEHLQECSLNLYADDMALYTACNSYIDLILKLRMELDIVAEWLKANKLMLNTSKTKYVINVSRNSLANVGNLNLSINNVILERLESM